MRLLEKDTSMRFNEAPFRETAFPSSEMRVERRRDGTLIVEPVEPLQSFIPSIPRELELWAARQPDKIYLAERPAPALDWRRYSYADTKRAADAVAQWLLNHRVDRDRSVLILSGNSFLHTALKYGAMSARVPVCPVSVNYSLLGGDYGRLRHVISLIRPAVIFAEQAERFGPALDAVDTADALLLTDDPGRLRRPAIAMADVLATVPGPGVAGSIDAIDPDEASVYMLTSGSTSLPKAVIQTQRMITANLAQGRQVLGETAGWREVMLDWLPWNHVSGTVTQMGVLTSGGTLYIDGGRPMPGLFEQSIANLKEIPIQFFVNVPVGYAMLADALEADAELRHRFFSRMRLMLYGGAALSRPLYERLQQLAVDTVGKRILFSTGFGATETSSGCMSIYFETEQPGIGLPMPGLSLKMVPLGDRYELRVKGLMVCRGYLNMVGGNAGLFDEDGYFRLGDSARLLDPDDIQKGLAFDGRLVEEFKLSTGTWVSAGHLRAQLLQACDPLLADALVCGEGRDYVAMLAWPRLEACRKLAGADPDSSPQQILAHPAVRDRVLQGLRSHNAGHAASSTKVCRMAFLLAPPSIDAHEVSDKGTINQSQALRRRAADVERLYAGHPDPSVLVAD
jgi:feruloyl-CoA synthase